MPPLPGTQPRLRRRKWWTEAVHPPPPISAIVHRQALALGVAERAWRWLWSLRAWRRGRGSIPEPRGGGRCLRPVVVGTCQRWQTALAVGLAEAAGGGEGRGPGRFPDPQMDNAGGANLFAGQLELEGLTPKFSPALGKKEHSGAAKAREGLELLGIAREGSGVSL